MVVGGAVSSAHSFILWGMLGFRWARRLSVGSEPAVLAVLRACVPKTKLPDRLHKLSSEVLAQPDAAAALTASELKDLLSAVTDAAISSSNWALGDLAWKALDAHGLPKDERDYDRRLRLCTGCFDELSEQQCHREILAALEELKLKSLLPPENSLELLLKFSQRASVSWKFVEEVWKHYDEFGIQRSLQACNSRIKLSVKLSRKKGDTETAYDAVKECLKQMQMIGQTPNLDILNSLMEFFSLNSDWESGKSVLRLYKELDVFKDFRSYLHWVLLCTNCYKEETTHPRATSQEKARVLNEIKQSMKELTEDVLPRYALQQSGLLFRRIIEFLTASSYWDIGKCFWESLSPYRKLQQIVDYNFMIRYCTDCYKVASATDREEITVFLKKILSELSWKCSESEDYAVKLNDYTLCFLLDFCAASNDWQLGNSVWNSFATLHIPKTKFAYNVRLKHCAQCFASNPSASREIVNAVQNLIFEMKFNKIEPCQSYFLDALLDFCEASRNWNLGLIAWKMFDDYKIPRKIPDYFFVVRLCTECYLVSNSQVRNEVRIFLKALFKSLNWSKLIQESNSQWAVMDIFKVFLRFARLSGDWSIGDSVWKTMPKLKLDYTPLLTYWRVDLFVRCYEAGDLSLREEITKSVQAFFSEVDDNLFDERSLAVLLDVSSLVCDWHMGQKVWKLYDELDIPRNTRAFNNALKLCIESRKNYTSHIREDVDNFLMELVHALDWEYSSSESDSVKPSDLTMCLLIEYCVFSLNFELAKFVWSKFPELKIKKTAYAYSAYLKLCMASLSTTSSVSREEVIQIVKSLSTEIKDMKPNPFVQSLLEKFAKLTGDKELEGEYPCRSWSSPGSKVESFTW